MKSRIGSVEDIDIIYLEMEREFPPEELKSKRRLKELMSEGYNLRIFEEEGIIGYMFYLEIDSSNSIWIEYLSVVREKQNQGYGSKIFIELLKRDKNIFLEAEAPDGIDINKDKRIRFYKRQGCKILDFDYKMPTPEGYMDMKLMTTRNKSIYEILTSIKYNFNLVHRDLASCGEVIAMNSESIKGLGEYF
ncbi:MAG: GNAT family N-acetyltransferase [Lachnospirales bacterium]